MSAVKRIRLEQKALPVSSEEDLNLITLKEQNQKLSKNYIHRLRIEDELKKKIERLEDTLRSCEDKEPENQLVIVNEDLRNRVEDLEHELEKSRVNERRLADDLDHLNREFNDLRRKTLQSSINTVDSIISLTSSSADQKNQQNQQQQQLLQNSHHLTSTSTSTSMLNSTSNSIGSSHDHITSNANKFGNSSSSIVDENVVLNQAKTIRDLELKLADSNRLAETRLKELESLNEDHKNITTLVDRLKAEAKCIPKETIVESAEYKTLQSHFSVLYNEATQLKTQLVESRALIIEMKSGHSRQIERMQLEEQRLQSDLRASMVNLETNLAHARNDLAIIRLEYENTVKAHDQTLKQDTELKKALTLLKLQCQQSKNDCVRLKKLLDEVKRHHHNNDSNKNQLTVPALHSNNSGANHNVNNNNLNNHAPNNNQNKQANASNEPDNNTQTANPNNHIHVNNNTMNSSTNNSSSNNHSPAMNKKILELKETIHQLQRLLEKTKSEEEALMQDLDVTGQAYEELQEQNHRLLQQLEQKDEANFKLMSEHLKTNAFQQHLTDEKNSLTRSKEILEQKIAAHEHVVKSLEEKIHLLQENMSTLEKELEKRNTLNDTYKQEKLDLEQRLAEIRSEKDKVQGHLEQIQKSFSERTGTLSNESFKNKRLVEELESLKKKFERANKLQSANTPDEVLMEEIREYKEQLTCPSCKTKPKDAVLTKCFHVFCFDCLKTRVDTRQRKCPKCNAQFGANDYHRLYLA